MNIPKDIKYSKEHEWVKIIDGDIVSIGITEFAQKELGDIVFVELPAINSKVKYMQPFGVVESVKAVSDLFSPVSGSVKEINTILEDEPELINKSPYDEGWIIKVKIDRTEELDTLMSSEEYKNYIKQNTN